MQSAFNKIFGKRSIVSTLTLSTVVNIQVQEVVGKRVRLVSCRAKHQPSSVTLRMPKTNTSKTLLEKQTKKYGCFRGSPVEN